LVVSLLLLLFLLVFVFLDFVILDFILLGIERAIDFILLDGVGVIDFLFKKLIFLFLSKIYVRSYMSVRGDEFDGLVN
jgi:hypothetical protein